MNYLYDDTFEGFLCCVYAHWYTGKAEGIYSERLYQLDMTRYAMSVASDGDKAARVLDAINYKISKWDAQRVYRVFCTDEPDKEMKLLRYISLGFKHGPRIRLLHGDHVVKAVADAEQRFGGEVHRFCGILRFSEVIYDGSALLYAKIRPDNDILAFLAPHFADRYKSDPFIIHDLKRGKALFAAGRRWQIDEAPESELQLSDEETDTRTLWKHYFEAMATKERINPKLQRKFIPARYWDELTEMSL